jgi:hypothetical protein
VVAAAWALADHLSSSEYLHQGTCAIDAVSRDISSSTAPRTAIHDTTCRR